MRRLRDVLLAVAFFFCAVAGASEVPDASLAISFQERLSAQRALDGVYHDHRDWPAHNPEARSAVCAGPTDAAIMAKVKDYLAKSRALEKFWNRRLSRKELQREIDRMAAGTRNPERLAELFAALDHDPHTVAECLARPLLANRLIRSWYAFDPRFHSDVKRRALREMAAVRSQGLTDIPTGTYSEGTYYRSDTVAQPTRHARAAGTPLASDQWETFVADLSSGLRTDRIPLNTFSALREDKGRFFAFAVLDKTEDRIRVGVLAWPKTAFDGWWAQQRQALLEELGNLDGAGFEDVGEGALLSLPPITGRSCATDTWRPMNPGSIPNDYRYGHTAVWTGTEMIVWGGAWWEEPLGSATGGRYDPVTDDWTATSAGPGVPQGRSYHTAVWTGFEMIVWGGEAGPEEALEYLASGARYDPSTDTWAAVSMDGAPAPRSVHTAVWTGTEMIVWGGLDENGVWNSGGKYDPSSNAWTSTPADGSLEARAAHAAVWAPEVGEMVVWGGWDGVDMLATGARYDPGDPSVAAWTPVSPSGLSARWGATAVWTGDAMLVWGGGTADDAPLGDGAAYDPVDDSWTAMATADAPLARWDHTAVWTGAEMIVWGGWDDVAGEKLDSGARYNPQQFRWTPTSTSTAPPPREGHTAIWTGQEMIVWGNEGTGRGGGRYDPTTDSWVPTTANIPQVRSVGHSAVWTGAEMVVWGGGDDFHGYPRKGARYDPATDSWAAMSLTDAPEGRVYAPAVWTGEEVIFWGGYQGDDHSQSQMKETGGRYNPTKDSWVPTSTLDAPQGRGNRSAIWTGTEMIVWGGWVYDNGYEDLNTGGRYNPNADTWQPTSIPSWVPSPGEPCAESFDRFDHSVVWTGTEMIVWGGLNLGTADCTGSSQVLTTGGRYDPATDTWSQMAEFSGGRREHTAVWTGEEMVIWGGREYLPLQPVLGDGARYDPDIDGWAPVASEGAPSPRTDHVAVWTGDTMIIWGGRDDQPVALDTGGVLDLDTDAWTPTSTGQGVLSPRRRHTAVWAGPASGMIVWGGATILWSNRRDGGLYCATGCEPVNWYLDSDEDGYGGINPSHLACDAPGVSWVPNAGDCDDSHPGIFVQAPEFNDGLDNQCPGDYGHGIIDEIGTGTGFFNPENKDEYSWPMQGGATLYEIARSGSPDFTGDCLVVQRSETPWTDAATPEAGKVFHYLTRSVAPFVGSWGRNSAGSERVAICP